MHTFNENMKKNQHISESRGDQRNCFKTPVSKCEKIRRISFTVCMLISSHITRHIGLVISRRTVRTIHMYIIHWDGIIFANMI